MEERLGRTRFIVADGFGGCKVSQKNAWKHKAESPLQLLGSPNLWGPTIRIRTWDLGKGSRRIELALEPGESAKTIEIWKQTDRVNIVLEQRVKRFKPQLAP